MMNNDIAAGKLTEGDYDSILLFGSEAQERIRAFSQSAADIMIRESYESVDAAADVLEKIEKFQYTKKSRSVIYYFKTRQKQKEAFIKDYRDLIAYIDKMVLSLQLQQAQLLKDSKILERMDLQAEKSAAELEACIENGETVLNSAKDRPDQSEWTARLGKRLDALKISHTLSLQNRAQLQIIQQNNSQLINRLADTVTITIPAWKNQAAMALGIEKTNILDNKGKQIDYEKLVRTNSRLIAVLNELADAEEKKKQSKDNEPFNLSDR